MMKKHVFNSAITNPTPSPIKKVIAFLNSVFMFDLDGDGVGGGDGDGEGMGVVDGDGKKRQQKDD